MTEGPATHQARIEQAVRATLQSVLGPERATRAAASDDMLRDGYLDSFALLETAAQLEVALDIIITPDLLTPEKFRTVQTIATLCVDVSVT